VGLLIFYRRRIERFAQLLDAVPRRRRHSLRDRSVTEPRPVQPEDLTGLVDLSQRLGMIAHPRNATPDDDFRAGLRAMLVATAQREGIGATARDGQVAARTPRPREAGTERAPLLRGRRTRIAIIVGLAGGTLALSGVSAASGNAMPGDALYGVKRSTEGARLALTTSDMMRGQLYLDFARTRAGEVRARWSNPGDLTSLLGDMDGETVQGARLLTNWAMARHDTTSLDFIDSWVKGQRVRLTGLAAEEHSTRVADSLDLLTEIEDRSNRLRVALECGVSLSRADRLGPEAPPCPNTGTRTSSDNASSTVGGGGQTGAAPDSGAVGSPSPRPPTDPAPTGSETGRLPVPATNPQEARHAGANPESSAARVNNMTSPAPVPEPGHR
jgi:hypothetical protein